MEMTITRGLAELKLLDRRIANGIDSAKFVAGNKKSSEKVLRLYTKEEFENKAKADFESIVDLIERRKAIKSAIVQSNATTYVEIAEKQYTVAEAIERKTSIAYEKTLLRELERQYKSAMSTINIENERVQDQLDRLLEVLAGKDGKNVALESNEMAKKYLEDNEYELVDPLKIVERIENMKKEIDEFEHEVDFCLSESNTITKIFIEN